MRQVADRRSFDHPRRSRRGGISSSGRVARDRRERRGVETLELILSLPILFVATLAIVEFSLLLLLQQAVVTAAIEGAREAAKVGATLDYVGETVQGYLGIHDIVFDTSGTDNTSDAQVIVETPNTSRMPDLVDGDGQSELGNTTIPCTPDGPDPTETQVRVTVCVRLTDDTGCRPVPNLLSVCGFSLVDKTLEVSSVANLECPFPPSP